MPNFSATWCTPIERVSTCYITIRIKCITSLKTRMLLHASCLRSEFVRLYLHLDYNKSLVDEIIVMMMPPGWCQTSTLGWIYCLYFEQTRLVPTSKCSELNRWTSNNNIISVVFDFYPIQERTYYLPWLVRVWYALHSLNWSFVYRKFTA